MNRPLGDLEAEVWSIDAGDVITAMGTDAAAGLSAQEAAGRLQRTGPNRLDATPPVPTWRKLLTQFTDPLVYLLIGAVAISMAVWLLDGADGVPFDAIVIGLILIVNAVLGYVQEARAEHAVAALQRMSTAHLFRDPRRGGGARAHGRVGAR